MGFLKGFPKELVGDVSAGTGFAGLVAAGTFFMAFHYQVKYELLFLVELLTVIPYMLAFNWLIK